MEKEHQFRIPLGSYVGIGVTSHALKNIQLVPAEGEEIKAEIGKVVARAEYLNGQDKYLVRYKAGDHRMVETWWDNDALYFINGDTDEEKFGPVI